MPQPADWFGGIIEQQRFAGGPSPNGEGFVPNITQASLDSYSVREIEEILDSGIVRKATASAPRWRAW